MCSLSHAFLASYLDGLQAPGVRAHLAPRPGRCCVTLTTADAPEGEPPAKPCHECDA